MINNKQSRLISEIMTTTELLALRDHSKRWNLTHPLWNHLSLSDFSVASVQYSGETIPEKFIDVSTGMLFDIQLRGRFAGKGYYQLSEKIIKYASTYHVPVLLKQVLNFLMTDPSGIYVDGTIGGGGHAEGILERLSFEGKLLGIDRDADAIAFARKRLNRFGKQVVLRQGNYDELDVILRESGILNITGILLDLGVSSFQLESGKRGFSYSNPGPLDMRMDSSDKLNAFDVVNEYPYKELKRIFKVYGEERQAGRIAMAILRSREKEPIKTTDVLARIIGRAVSPVHRNKVLSRVFQAIRIEVNQELVHLESALSQAVQALGPNGRLVVISYHSLEDRIVKHFFRKMAQPCECSPGLPICPCDEEATLKILTRKPVEPSPEEKIQNPRARSAKLRVAEKI